MGYKCRVESKAGEAQITRATPKLSYAKIIDGQMKEGYICRPLGGELGYSQGRDANYQLNDGGGINLGFYAILQNFANLKI